MAPSGSLSTRAISTPAASAAFTARVSSVRPKSADSSTLSFPANKKPPKRGCDLLMFAADVVQQSPRVYVFGIAGRGIGGSMNAQPQRDVTLPPGSSGAMLARLKQRRQPVAQ